jgi:molecular chaperone GrpE (heat shock protein)
MKIVRYCRRLLSALLGHEEAVPEDGTAAQARIATLEMDVNERDDRIAAMQAEYAQLEASKGRATASAGQDEMERLFKRLAGPLSNLATLVELARHGEAAESGDFVQLFDALERELGRAGLERIGTVGEETDFDVALHQRISGTTVHAGTPVSVQMPGYRMEAKVLLKAMVTTKDAGDE